MPTKKIQTEANYIFAHTSFQPCIFSVKTCNPYFKL